MLVLSQFAFTRKQGKTQTTTFSGGSRQKQKQTRKREKNHLRPLEPDEPAAAAPSGAAPPPPRPPPIPPAPPTGAAPPPGAAPAPTAAAEEAEEPAPTGAGIGTPYEGSSGAAGAKGAPEMPTTAPLTCAASWSMSGVAPLSKTCRMLRRTVPKSAAATQLSPTKRPGAMKGAVTTAGCCLRENREREREKKGLISRGKK